MSGTSLRSALTRRTIGDKAVVSFQSHHYALLPWREWQQTLGMPLRLVSIDHHTDTDDAFTAYAYSVGHTGLSSGESWEERQLNRLAKVSANDAASVEDAVRDLRHSEHIDTAIRVGILDAAFIMAHAGDEALPSVADKMPQDRMVLLGLNERCSNDDAIRQFRDRILEPDFLIPRLACAGQICRFTSKPDLLATPFVLDIDLDSFNTRKSVRPHDPHVFHDLIRRAHAITIAQESRYVQECQLKGEELTSCWLEQEILTHVRWALS